jgi:hypothetical protein
MRQRATAQDFMGASNTNDLMMQAAPPQQAAPIPSTVPLPRDRSTQNNIGVFGTILASLIGAKPQVPTSQTQISPPKSDPLPRELVSTYSPARFAETAKEPVMPVAVTPIDHINAANYYNPAPVVPTPESAPKGGWFTYWAEQRGDASSSGSSSGGGGRD